MKCIKVIKGTNLYEMGTIQRVDEKLAEQRVSSGYWTFISKSEWKENGRVAPIQQEERKKKKEKLEEKNYKKKNKKKTK